MIKYFFLKIINFYIKYISPMFPRRCRYYPTCSMYAKEAITEHGAIYGLILSVIRICKCNPFFKGGVDLVPEKNKNK